MPIELKMPALSPTMEEGTLAKWLVKEGDKVESGDILAEIETDKATMEFEAVDEGTVAKILVPEGTDGVKVGAPIALIAEEGESVDAAAPAATAAPQEETSARPAKTAEPAPPPQAAVETPAALGEIPPEAVKLSNMRKTIARRLTEAKQTIPHYYLTVDVQLDALLKLRSELNASLESRGVKLSVYDLLIKALAMALIEVPVANVSFAGDQMLKYSRADISVAVAIPDGLITPIIVDASGKTLSKISAEMTDLAGRAKEGRLQPHEYQGGTASISNLGMFGTKQFDAVINPPQAMIMAVGAGEKRPYVVDDSLQIATVMSATGSFDHRAIDGADGARLMKAFKGLCEKPLGLVA